MRSLTRLGVTVAAAALASTAALSGAAVAGADTAEPKPVFNSPSSVAVEGKGAATKVIYTNKSEHNLFCYSFAGPGGLMSDFYNESKKADADTEMPTKLEAQLITAMSKGQVGFYAGEVEKGKTVDLTSVASIPGFEGAGAGITDNSFTPAALAICTSESGTHIEVEISAGAGVPAGLGSLDSALAGIGSSGSVAGTFGSLGS